MLPRERTLTRKLFPRHTDVNVLWNGTTLRIRCYTKRVPDEKPRFAVVVSKKQYRTIAERNLFKRRVFASLRPELPLLDRCRFGAYVIYPRSSVEHIAYKDIVADTKALIAQCLGA